MRRSLSIRAFCAVTVIGFSLASAQAAHFEFDSGGFTGQRGLGMKFGDLLDDGFVDQWDQTPPGPATQVHRMELNHPPVGVATLTATRTASATTSGNSLSITNMGRVEVEAGSAGDSWNTLWVGRNNISSRIDDERTGHAHCDSYNQQVAYTLLPGEGERIGDPVWLTFNGTFDVTHRINDRRYGRWTTREGTTQGQDWTIETAGILGGPYPAPMTAYVRSPDSVRNRPVVQAPRDLNHSARIFDGQRIAARIGDTVVLEGGPLPWLSVKNLPVQHGERILAQVRSQVDVAVSEGDPFALQGPLQPIADSRRLIDDDLPEERTPEEEFASFSDTAGDWPS